MKRVVCVVLVVMTTFAVYAEQLTVGTIGGMMRYSPAVVKVLGGAGYEITVRPFDTQEELIKAAATGSVDGAFFLAQPVIAQIKGSVMIPARLMNSDFCAISTDSSVTVSNPGDLRKYTVGVVKGHPGHAAVTRGMKVFETQDDMDQFKQLAEGKYQVAIVVQEMVPSMARASGLKTYYIQQPPLMRTPTFFMLGSGKASHRKPVEDAFKKAMDSGAWEREIAAAGQ
jgi:ABC-type nitrate/sulfonate/bicarbonate transport system substrate-binding protein